MSVRPIQFYHRGQIQQIEASNPTQTVLQYLREDCHHTGTKEGCAEGDCGACTVMVGELHTQDGEQVVQLRAINSCIQFLPALDGKALFTVEDVAKAGQPNKTLKDPQALHPIQQAMVDKHASQCGFCTPGFVMSLWAMYENHAQVPTREQVVETLSGNLCRCTGYRPIVDAAIAAYNVPRQTLDTQPVLAALKQLHDLPALAYAYNQQHFFAPKTIAELVKLRLEKPQARLLAGSTDVGLWVTKLGRQLGDIIYLGAVDALKAITKTDGYLQIGAMVSLTDAFAALTDLHVGWAELARIFASKPVQNAGTLGGNVANGSPIGDSMPALLALNASLLLQHGDAVRELPLDQFYLDYQKNALAVGEFVLAIRVPYTATANFHFATYKVSKRLEQDISAVCAAYAVQLNDAGVVQSARVAYGGMAATPKRAANVEQALMGQVWHEAAIEQAKVALNKDFSPLSDGRASSDYRQQVAANLLQRFYLSTQSSKVPTRLSDLIALQEV